MVEMILRFCNQLLHDLMMFEDIPPLVRWLQWNSIVLATVMLVAGRFIPGRGSAAALDVLAMPAASVSLKQAAQTQQQ